MSSSSANVPLAVRAAKSNAKVSPANIEQHANTSAAPQAPVHGTNSVPTGNSAHNGNSPTSSNTVPTNNSAPRGNIATESGQDHPEGTIHLFCICILML